MVQPKIKNDQNVGLESPKTPTAPGWSTLEINSEKKRKIQPRVGWSHSKISANTPTQNNPNSNPQGVGVILYFIDCIRGTESTPLTEFSDYFPKLMRGFGHLFRTKKTGHFDLLMEVWSHL